MEKNVPRILESAVPALATTTSESRNTFKHLTSFHFRRRLEFAVRARELADRISPSGDHRIDWDPQRIRVDPLISTVKRGEKVRLRVAVDNPSKTKTGYTIRVAPGLIARNQQWQVAAEPATESTIPMEFDLPSSISTGRLVIPFEVRSPQGIDPSDTFAVLQIE